MMTPRTHPTIARLSASFAALAVTAVSAPGGDSDIPGPNFSYEIVSVGPSSLEYGTGLIVHGDRVYIADSASLAVLDISGDGLFPLVESVVFNHGDEPTLFINDDHLYTKMNYGFGIWNIEDPDDPWFVRNYSPESGYQLSFTGNRLMTTGATVIDVDFPYAPARNTFVDGVQNFILAIEDNRVLTDDLDIWDLTDPFDPQLVAPSTVGTINANQIIEEGDLYYARNNSNFTILERTGPESFEIRGSFTLSNNGDFAVRGSIITSIDEGDLIFTNVSNPADPITLGTIEKLGPYGSAVAFQWKDDLLYTLTNDGTLLALRIYTNPVGTHATTDEAVDIALVDDLALIADTDGGMKVFDVSNPAVPVLRSTYPTANTALGIDAIPGVAFIAAHQAGLDIVDISDPANPTLITNFHTGNSVRDVQIVGNLAYVVNRVQGLIILDITDPANPAVVSTTDTPGLAEDITIAGDLALIPHGTYDMQIMDISDPSAPFIVSSITPLDDSNNNGIDSATLHGDTLYTSERDNGFRRWDFSNPPQPIETGRYDTTIDPDFNGFARMTQIIGSRLVLANGQNGLLVYNNSDQDPQPILHIPVQSQLSTVSLRRFKARDNLLYSAVGEAGLRIYDLTNGFDCPADFDNSGDLNFFDLSGFIAAYTADDLAADFDNDGRLTFFDLANFLASFNAGCP